MVIFFSCKDGIFHIEQNAQFLSDIYDEHRQLKVKMNSIANIIESERSENKYMRGKILTLKPIIDLLFFEIEENTETGADGCETGNVEETGQKKESEICVEAISDFVKKF